MQYFMSAIIRMSASMLCTVLYMQYSTVRYTGSTVQYVICSTVNILTEHFAVRLYELRQRTIVSSIQVTAVHTTVRRAPRARRTRMQKYVL